MTVVCFPTLHRWVAGDTIETGVVNAALFYRVVFVIDLFEDENAIQEACHVDWNAQEKQICRERGVRVSFGLS